GRISLFVRPFAYVDIAPFAGLRLEPDLHRLARRRVDEFLARRAPIARKRRSSGQLAVNRLGDGGDDDQATENECRNSRKAWRRVSSTSAVYSLISPPTIERSAAARLPPMLRLRTTTPKTWPKASTVRWPATFSVVVTIMAAPPSDWSVKANRCRAPAPDIR